MSQALTNWTVGPGLIILGLFHNVVGGRLVTNWLETAEPPLPLKSVVTGSAGFELGGYFAIAAGFSFVVLSDQLVRGYYLLWGLTLVFTGCYSLYLFRSAHVSQVVIPLGLLVLAYYQFNAA